MEPNNQFHRAPGVLCKPGCFWSTTATERVLTAAEEEEEPTNCRHLAIGRDQDDTQVPKNVVCILKHPALKLVLRTEGMVVKIGTNLDFEAIVEKDVSGFFVSPGWIDLHTHVYQHATTLGVDPDEHCLLRGRCRKNLIDSLTLSSRYVSTSCYQSFALNASVYFTTISFSR